MSNKANMHTTKTKLVSHFIHSVRKLLHCLEKESAPRKLVTYVKVYIGIYIHSSSFGPASKPRR